MINGFILLVGLAGVLAEINCPNDKLTPEMRQKFVDEHNKFRSQLAHGKTVSQGGVPMPGAKNMLEVSWNCKLEETGQKWVDYCKFQHSPVSFRKGSGENLYMSWSFDSSELPEMAKQSPVASTVAWWDEVQKYNLSANPENLLTIPVFEWGVGHFTQVAWANTFQIGCGVTICNSQGILMVACEYWPPGNYLNNPIYEQGKACTKDSDCSSNQCNVSNGLCIHHGGPVYP